MGLRSPWLRTFKKKIVKLSGPPPTYLTYAPFTGIRIWVSLLFIYVNDLPSGITSICKIFVNDTSFFIKVLDVNESTRKLNLNLQNISEWTFQWKIKLHPDPNEQSNEVIFSQKSKVHSYLPLTFNNNDAKKCPHQKQLVIILDSKLDFNILVDNKIKNLYLPSTNLSSDHIWTMEISDMISQKIKIFKIN